MLNFLRSKPPKTALPRLSVVMVAHRMVEQAARTLHSLSPAYQRGVEAGDYEIILIENDSDQLLGEADAMKAADGASLRYLRAREHTKTPVHAMNEGVRRARAPHVALLIDGARMLSPGALRSTLDALRLDPEAAVSAPSYHLGHELQQITVNKGHDAATDRALLGSVGWPQDGYRLFDIAVLSGSCRAGFFRPHAESNFLAMSRAKWDRIGGMDLRYRDHGGGRANLDLYKRVLESPGTALYLLYAEGSFHQFHGGITTNTPEAERRSIMAAIEAQDKSLRGSNMALPINVPILLGAPHPGIHRFLQQSLTQGKPTMDSKPA